MPVRRRARFATRRPRRELVWATSTGSQAASANGQYINIDLLQTYKGTTGADTAGITLLRTIGYLVLQSPVAADSVYVGIRKGDLKQTTASFGATAATVPNSRDDPYVNWSYLTRLMADNNGQFGDMYSSYQGIHFDIKSKRRMHLLQEAYILSIVQDNVTTVAKSYTWFARTLIALS